MGAENWHTAHKSQINVKHGVKNDPIPQILSQEPPIPSKYDFNDRAFLTLFYSCLRTENWHTTE